MIWRSFADSPAEGYWHDTMPRDLLEGSEAKVLVTPGHFRDAEDINLWLSLNGPAIVWILGDEEGDCPFWQIKAPVWKQFPNPHRPYWPDRVLPLGYTPHTRPVLQALGLPLEKTGWVLSGQNTNERRKQAFTALERIDATRIHPSPTFAGGIEPKDFIRQLWEVEWAPSPAGNVRADSFRMWEALEAGAVPILDSTTPAGDRNIWSDTLGDHPLPVVGHWDEVAEILEGPAPMGYVGAWYTRYKRNLREQLRDDWIELGNPWWPEPEHRLAAIVTASPLPSHPGFEILRETVESIRDRLPGREICIAFDGPRDTDDRAVYEEHIRRVAWWANQYWPETWLWYTGIWKHQAGTVKDVLPHMREQALLMVEADTPLVGEIPFRELVTTLYTGESDLIRLHYDTRIHPDHQYLMRGHIRAHGLDLVRTVQYSQRPHLVRRQFYSDLLSMIPDHARTYIEDAVYGPVANSPWDHNKITIYAPENMQRSTHLDGRAGVPKGEFWV